MCFVGKHLIEIVKLISVLPVLEDAFNEIKSIGVIMSWDRINMAEFEPISSHIMKVIMINSCIFPIESMDHSISILPQDWLHTRWIRF